MPKSYRIKATPGVDKHIDINLEQDFDFIEILSLKISQSEVYTRVCSDYGVIVGRVSVNNGYGLPNAKVSVFIPLTDEDSENPIISELYPYKTLVDRDENGYRYNLLPKSPSYTNHLATGSFPDKDEVLVDQSWVEVYDKYYKFTVKTNDSGDYMIFGVPTGSQTLVMDVDLSDIGCFSLTPQDLIRNGNATENDFNGSNFKTSTNLDELPQIINFNTIVDVSPLWGDTNICQFGINRVDFDLTKEFNIKINPVSVFLGSIMSNTDENSVKTGNFTSKCKPKKDTGKFCELITGPGQILSIRQTINLDSEGLPILEEHKLINEGKVIDENGTFVVDLPMNLDYITTNEFGEQILSLDPNVGIPTKGKYRFKVKWQNQNGNDSTVIRPNFLIPNIKEYGWVTSDSDPYDYPQFQVFYVGGNGASGITAGLTTYSEIMSFTGGLTLLEIINAEDISLTIDSVPYAGSLESINVSSGNIFEWNFTPIDLTQNVIIKFQFFDEGYFNLLKSYAFSLDWDDYVNQAEAINCEDTFYEFNYNKVYTTSMFLDRYKYGNARWMHLGIKEIDDRECRTENNIYPVNDIIRNQDLWFQLLIFLLNILTFPILALIVLAHIVYTLWPLVKLLLGVSIVLAGYFAAQAAINLVTAAGFVIDIFGPLPIFGYIVLGLAIAGLTAAVGLSGYLLFLYFKYILPLKRTPISLPLLSYPECTTCECKCEEPEVDDITLEDIQNGIDSFAPNNSELSDSDIVLATSKSILAPINLSSSYNIEHPNLPQKPGFDTNDPLGGWFYNGGEYKSLLYLTNNNELDTDITVQASIDFRRLFSGYDVINDDKLHAPQPFLFAGDKSIGQDERWFGFPTDVTYPQKLNEFNTRDKYFNNASSLGSLNRITTTVNPSLGSDSFDDQILVVLVKPGNTGVLIDKLINFQNPVDSPSYINITGATENQFLTNSITGITSTGTIDTPIIKYINYANPSDPTGLSELTSQVKIVQTTNNQEFVYPNDIEYFQVITGMSIAQYLTISNTDNNPELFHEEYLRHKINYIIAKASTVSTDDSSNFPFATGPDLQTFFSTIDGTTSTRQIGNYDSLETLTAYQSYELLFLTRGVDPYTDKQEIKYDLSRIFGFTTPNTITFTGSRYLNYPIQATGTQKPKSHNTNDNTDNKLYHPSFTFTITSPYTAYTSLNPYYYLSTDDTSLDTLTNGGSNYKPNSNGYIVSELSNMKQLFGSDGEYRVLPNKSGEYILGAPFIASNFYNLYSGSTGTNYLDFSDSYFLDKVSGTDIYGYPKNLTAEQDIYSVYSPAYYKYPLLGVNFSDSTKLVMRSDRLPTSDKTEEVQSETSFALHQNDNFIFYINEGLLVDIPISTGPQEINGESFDQDSMITGLTESLECPNMVPLNCYEGTGTNLSVNIDCADKNKKRFTNGCYCFPNKKLGVYILGIIDDWEYYLEWKTRFTVLYAACRGIFSQTFQNNWINGNLYMFPINNEKIISFNPNKDASFNFCDHNVIYNEISDNFYYRSSPWYNTTNSFIGSKRTYPFIVTPGLSPYALGGENDKQIQFPTTILDLGPRDQFINEICGNNNLQGPFINQIKSTSYQDNSDIVKIGFLSRLVNANFLKSMFANVVNNSFVTEGVGIDQFFNSTREGYRIDGDFAQALSINSEFKVRPFASDTYPDNFIYIGEDNTVPLGRGLFGIFYTSSTQDVQFRRRYSPGVEVFNQTPLIEYSYGYPNTQVVPHYRWKLKSDSSVIFGSEDNNWNTTPDTTTGFYSKGYQDLNYITDPYFKILGGTSLGYITKFDPDGTPNPSNTSVSPGLPPFGTPVTGDLAHIIVGTPYQFYFGLKAGKTAINRYIQIYLNTE